MEKAGLFHKHSYPPFPLDHSFPLYIPLPLSATHYTNNSMLLKIKIAVSCRHHKQGRVCRFFYRRLLFLHHLLDRRYTKKR